MASITQSTKTWPMAGADLRTVNVKMSPVTMRKVKVNASHVDNEKNQG